MLPAEGQKPTDAGSSCRILDVQQVSLPPIVSFDNLWNECHDDSTIFSSGSDCYGASNDRMTLGAGSLIDPILQDLDTIFK